MCSRHSARCSWPTLSSWLSAGGPSPTEVSTRRRPAGPRRPTPGVSRRGSHHRVDADQRHPLVVEIGLRIGETPGLGEQAPAPTRNRTHAATCIATSPDRRREPRASADASPRDAWARRRPARRPVGASVMSTADTTAAAARNANTRTSGSIGTRTFSTGKKPAGNVARTAAGKTRAATMTRTSPAAAAGTASTRLSTINWRATRHRLAPSASRTTISGCRASARASIRFVMLAQATKSTRPNADRMSGGAKTPSARREGYAWRASRRARPLAPRRMAEESADAATPRAMRPPPPRSPPVADARRQQATPLRVRKWIAPGNTSAMVSGAQKVTISWPNRRACGSATPTTSKR